MHADSILATKAGLHLIKSDTFGAKHNEWMDTSRPAPP